MGWFSSTLRTSLVNPLWATLQVFSSYKLTKKRYTCIRRFLDKFRVEKKERKETDEGGVSDTSETPTQF
jgi:hypothetical protein